MEKEMNLQDALALITKLGLSVVSNDGTVKAKAKKKISSRRAKGSGTIYTLKGNRSKPWVASVTIGYDDETGRQIQKPLGYFKTQGEAQTALSAYELQNKGLIEENSLIKTSDIEKPKNKCPTFKEIWDIIFAKDIAKLSNSSKINYKTAFNKLTDIHCVPVNKISLHDLQPIFDKEMELGSGAAKLSNIKVVAQKIFTYAMKYDYIIKDYSQYITYEATNEKRGTRKPFTKEEIQLLFKKNTIESKIILIYIFTGLRPQELTNIKKSDVYLDEKYMIGGIKTSNGKNRIIPLHESIIPFIKELYESNTKYMLFNFTGRKAYDKYRMSIFNPAMENLKLKHEAYDTRHTFATLCNENNLNEYLIKKMMGHSSKDLTKDVYTHATVERLIAEVNKIKIC